MARRLRAHDWGSTPLGPLANWPSSLKTIVDLVLASPMGMIVLWGPDLIQIYNDSYRIVMGAKHPAGLGQATRECWPEVWPFNEPIYQAVFRGEAKSFTDQPLILARNGSPEETWFDLTYSPLRDESGAVAGVLVTVVEVTERHRAETARTDSRRALSESQDRLQVERKLLEAVIRQAPVGISIAEAPSGRVIALNDMAVELLGHDQRGKNIERYAQYGAVHPDGRPYAVDDYPTVRALKHGEVIEQQEIIYRRCGRDGEMLTRLAASSAPVRDDAGNIVAVATVFFDVEEQRRAETALRESEERLQIAIDAADLGSWNLDLNTGAVTRSLRHDEMFGYSELQAEWNPAIAERHMLGEDRPIFREAFARALDTGRLAFEVRVCWPDGSMHWVASVGRVYFGDDGTPKRMAGVVTDITARKRAELERDRFFDLSVDMLALASMADGYWKRVNPAFTRILGWSEQELLAMPFFDIVHPDDVAASRAAMADLALGKPLAQFEHRVLCKNGSFRWIAWNTASYPVEGLMYCIGRDVTARRKAERDLRRSEHRLRSLIEGIPQLVWQAEGAGEWIWSSPQWHAFTGLSDDRSLGHGWLEAVHPDDRDLALRAWSATQESVHLGVEYRIRHAATGHYRWFQTRATPVRHEQGAIVDWFGTSTDIDELRRLQDQQSVLVAELQHRTRNLLAVVQSIARQTIRTAPSLESFEAQFTERLAALSRVQGLISHSQHEAITIGALVRTELDALGASAHQAKMHLEGLEVPLHDAAVQTMALAIHELATNARKYGALSVETGRLSITWDVAESSPGERWLSLRWVETGTAPLDREPDPAQRGRGYGRQLIERALPYSLGARTRFVMEADGIRCEIDLPLPQAEP